MRGRLNVSCRLRNLAICGISSIEKLCDHHECDGNREEEEEGDKHEPEQLLSYIKAHLFIYLFTSIGLLPGGSGYFTCKQNMKFVTTKFKSGGLHEKHVVATWNLGNHLSICF